MRDTKGWEKRETKEKTNTRIRHLMKKQVKTERKKNLERSCSHINLQEHKIISRKYYVQGPTVYLTFMLSRLLSRWSLNKELESLHSSGFHCWKLHLLHQDVRETPREFLCCHDTASTAIPAYKDGLGWHSAHKACLTPRQHVWGYRLYFSPQLAYSPLMLHRGKLCVFVSILHT